MHADQVSVLSRQFLKGATQPLCLLWFDHILFRRVRSVWRRVDDRGVYARDEPSSETPYGSPTLPTQVPGNGQYPRLEGGLLLEASQRSPQRSKHFHRHRLPEYLLPQGRDAVGEDELFVPVHKRGKPTLELPRMQRRQRLLVPRLSGILLGHIWK